MGVIEELKWNNAAKGSKITNQEIKARVNVQRADVASDVSAEANDDGTTQKGPKTKAAAIVD